MRFKNAVVFAILMQNNDGILGKSPSYVVEKLSLCEMMDDASILLDDSNTKLYQKYIHDWNVSGAV